MLDPRHGGAAAAASLAAVIATDATAADAWSTALLVLGDCDRTEPSTVTAIHQGNRWVHRGSHPSGRFDGLAGAS